MLHQGGYDYVLVLLAYTPFFRCQRSGRTCAWQPRLTVVRPAFPVQFCSSVNARKEYSAAFRYADQSLLCHYIGRCVTEQWKAFEGQLIDKLSTILSPQTRLRPSSQHREPNTTTTITSHNYEGDNAVGAPLLHTTSQDSSEHPNSTGLISPHSDEEAWHQYVRRQQIEATCIICFGVTPAVCLLCCGAACHVDCLWSWQWAASQGGSKQCPACRHAFSTEELEASDAAAVVAAAGVLAPHGDGSATPTDTYLPRQIRVKLVRQARVPLTALMQLPLPLLGK